MENNLKTKTNDATSLILGKDRMGNVFEFSSDRPYNTLIIGQDGFGETPTQVFTYIFQLINRGESAIINDLNGVIYKYTASLFKERGYEIRVVNPACPQHSDTFNGLAHSNLTEDEIYAMAESIFPKSLGDSEADRFYTLSCRNLVTGLMQYVSYNEKIEEKIFDTVVDMLRQIKYNHDVLSEIYEKSVPHGKRLLGVVWAQRDEIRKETIERTLAGMEKFANRANYPVFATKCVDFKLTKTAPCAYFFVGDNASYYPFDKSFLFSQVFAAITGNGITVNFILNQFANSGLLENVDAILALAGNKNCRVLMCVNTLLELRTMYPKKYEMIFAQFRVICANEIYDELTAVTINLLCGKKVLECWKKTSEIIKKPFPLSFKKTVSEDVVSIDTLKNFDNNLTIAIIQGENPLLLEKYDFREHPKADKIVKSSVHEYTPYVYRGVREEE